MSKNKILIIPDIHGRDFWIEPCQNWQGSIIFLGDYHDPYGDFIITEPGYALARKNLQNLAEFVITRRKDPNVGETCCLCGNHDLFYYTGNNGCRADRTHFHEVEHILDKLNLQISYELVYDVTVHNSFLFTHAGVTKDWADEHSLSITDIRNLSLKDYTILEEIPASRGGSSKHGSCVWNSLEDYMSEQHLPEYFQIFGHTWCCRTRPVIGKDFAMLDCAKAFILNTETKEIIEWKK